MYLRGRIFKDPQSDWWCAEFHPFCTYVQGNSEVDALAMLKDAIELGFEGFRFTLTFGKREEGEVLLQPENTAEAIGIIVRQNRNESDLTLQEVAERTGAKYPGAVACYENASREASISKLDELMRAMKKKVVISIVDDEVA